jgi:GGDEF domain-containing protein
VISSSGVVAVLAKLRKSKILKLTLLQSVLISFAFVLVAVIASVIWISQVEETRLEKAAQTQTQTMTRQAERLVEAWTAQVHREVGAIVDAKAALTGIAQRTGAVRVSLLTPNADVLAEGPGAKDVQLAPTAVATITAKAMEYGRASGLLPPNSANSRSPLYVVASKLRDPANSNDVNVLLVVFPLNSAIFNEVMAVSGKRVISLSYRHGIVKLGPNEVVLLKGQGDHLVANAQSDLPPESDLWMLVAPGLAIGFVSSLLAAAFLISAVRRQAERLALLRKAVDSHAQGKVVKLSPSKQRDGVTQLAKSLRLMIEVTSEREKHLLKLAYRDVDTDLPNRILYNERIALMLDQVASAEQCFSILAMRVVGLSAALEVVSPDSRIRLLKDLSTRLLRCVRPSEDMDSQASPLSNATVARLDEDVFGILLPQTDVHQAQGLAAALIQNVTHQFTLDERKIHLRPVIGVASYPSHGVAGMVLHRAALAALADAESSDHAMHLFGQPVKVSAPKRDALPKVAVNRDEFDFDWDKIAG